MQLKYFLMLLAFYILPYIFYLSISHGLGHKAVYLQLRRFIPCAISASLPAILAQLPLNSNIFISSLIIGLSWIITYPLLYYLTYRKTSPDFGFHLDIVFGLYCISWLTSLKILIINFNILPIFLLSVISIIEFTIILLPIVQWIYYLLYKSVISESALLMIQGTHHNEIIEYFKSLPIYYHILSLSSIFLFISLLLNLNLNYKTISLPLSYSFILIVLAVFLTTYLFKKNHGVFIRTGLIKSYSDVKKYIKQTLFYQTNLKKRINALKVTPNKPNFSEPSTIIMVIGESESRDYMSAFTDYEFNTTPWLLSKKDNKNFILFPKTYSTVTNTIFCLEKALTEANQYNDKSFASSCSVIDIAHKAGYKTYWYSNQGYLEGSSTSVSVLANTAQTAKWTSQNSKQIQYDESLLDYLPEINPAENNFVVLHLNGSHFNFINRYPKEFTKWGEPGKYDLLPNYLNTIAYTDSFLEKVFEYAKKHLNLQAMLYFSDHACKPDNRRSPDFDGFASVRIPMFAYFSDEYITKHSDTFNALSKNRNKYFTNDLVYELMCGIFDIKSNHYDETNSLASTKYKYTRDMLKTALGTIYINQDNND